MGKSNKRLLDRQRAADEAVRESWRQDDGRRLHDPDDLKMITSELYTVRATGEVKLPLRDKFDFREAKRKTMNTRRLYRLMGDTDRADKLAGCATHLEFYENADGSKRTLHGMNACQSRMCPMCAARKARRTASRLFRILDDVDAAHKRQYRGLFLTLTIRNVKADDLRAALDLLTTAWAKLRRRRCFVRAVRGWFRAIEITYNKTTGEYHPHIHAILLVDKDYYDDKNGGAVKNGLYIRQGMDTDAIKGYKNPTWVQLWRESLRADYDPSVQVSAVRKKRSHDTTDAATRDAVVEAAKYATKDADFLDPTMPDAEAAAVLRTYTDALTRKRLTAMGGWIQEAADKLDLDPEDVTDLVHDDEDSADALTSGTAEYIAVYGFRFRYGDYFLRDRYKNPDYQGLLIAKKEDTT